MLARIGLLDRPQHEEVDRLHVQLLSDLLADALPDLTTTRTDLLRLRQIVNDLVAFEVLG
jgi:hypothetical protein